MTIDKQGVIEILSREKSGLESRFGVTGLSVFVRLGSDTISKDYGVGILVAFDGPTKSQNYFGMRSYIENLLGCSVDLITKRSVDQWRDHLSLQRLSRIKESLEAVW